jgi:hypothetical protein
MPVSDLSQDGWSYGMQITLQNLLIFFFLPPNSWAQKITLGAEPLTAFKHVQS